MNEKLKLNRVGDDVYFQNTKLTINRQSSKGPNNEVVKIVDLPGSNGQKWLSLSKIKEGTHEYECSQSTRSTTNNSKDYELNESEELEVKRLQSEIDSIIESARKRFVKRPNLNVNLEKLTETEKLDYMNQIEKYLNDLKSRTQ